MKKQRPSKKLFVEKIPCGRCPALAEREVTADEIVQSQKQPKPEATDTLRITYLGQEVVKYPYLCAACQEIVAKYIHAIGEVTKQASIKQRKKGQSKAA